MNRATPLPERLEVMTLVFTDLVGSTRLKDDLGNAEALRLIHEHHGIVRGLLQEFPDGVEVSTAGDSFFLAFRRPSSAVEFALRVHERVRRWNQTTRREVTDRIGIHAGEVTVQTGPDGRIKDLHGLEVDKCARVMSLASSGQVLLTKFAFENARASLKGQPVPEVGEPTWAQHGLYGLKGVAEPVDLCEVAGGRPALGPPADSGKAWRIIQEGGDAEDGSTPVTGWRRVLSGARIGRRLTWGGALVTAFAGAVTLVLPLFQPLTDASYDLAYLFRKVEKPRDAVIVLMDRESHGKLNQKYMMPWDRRVHAALVDKMREAKARAVIFDVLFDQPAADPQQDAAFMAALGRYTNVVLAGMVGEVVRDDIRMLEPQGPFPELAGKVPWGLTFFPGLEDQPAREPYLGTSLKGDLASEAARLLGKEPPRGGGSIWLNYYGPPSTIEWWPYWQVMSNQVPAALFENKVVFVGAVFDIGYTGGRRTDERATPYTRWAGKKAAGVEIVATTTLNFLHGEWLRRLSPWTELFLVLLAGGLAGYGCCRLRPLPTVTAGALAAVLAACAGMACVWPTRIWFPWLVVCAVELPVAVAWSVLAWTSSSPRKRPSRRTPADASAGASRPLARDASPIVHASGPVARSLEPVRNGATEPDGRAPERPNESFV